MNLANETRIATDADSHIEISSKSPLYFISLFNWLAMSDYRI